MPPWYYLSMEQKFEAINQTEELQQAREDSRKVLALGVGALAISTGILAAEVTDVMPDVVPTWLSVLASAYVASGGVFAAIASRSMYKDSVSQARS